MSACAAAAPDAAAEPDPGSADPRVRHVELPGSSFGEQGDYQVYLPLGYAATAQRRYPVLYLLHGAGHDDAYWLSVGVAAAADEAVAADRVAPMLIVMPNGGPTFTSTSGEAAFDDYMADELVPHVDARWRTRTGRGSRAVGGISLGGGRALQVAADRPSLFGSVGAHSPVVQDPAGLARRFAGSGTRIYLDVGDEDSLRAGVESLDRALQRLDVAHELHVGEGTHVEAYWTAHLRDYLAFYDAGFTAGGPA